MKLTITDYKILKFVSKNPNYRKQDILKKFKSDKSIEYRLEKLTENKLLMYIIICLKIQAI